MSTRETATERISEIVRRRLLGDPITEIAGDLGISRQYIYNVLSRLPKNDKAAKLDSSLSINEQFNIVIDYLDCFPFPQEIKKYGREKCEKEAIMAVADGHNLDYETVYNALCRMTDYHPSVRHYPYYTNIERWKIQKAVSFKDFSEAVRCPQATLNAILKCWKHMPFDLALKIKAFSGLSIEEIYSDLLKLDETES